MRNSINTNRQIGVSVSRQTVEVLKKIRKAAASSHDPFKKSIPSILLVGDVGAGRSEFSRAYERMLATNYVYTVRGANTYLELVFPKDGEERDYSRFFSSPGKVASFQNRFYGVFAISFEEWKGTDLLGSRWFEDLITFIDNNKENIYFIFQITTSFGAKEGLERVLRNHVNLVEADLKQPGLQVAADYVQKCMEEDGIVFDESGKKELRELLGRRLNVDSAAFAGYTTLQQVSKCILFELMSDDSMKTYSTEVTDNMLRNIESRIIIPEDTSEKRFGIGFAM